MFEKKKVVFALMDYNNVKNRVLISKFIMDNSCIPVYPNMVPDFFTTVDVRPTLKAADDHEFIRKCDEVWVFGREDRKTKENIKIAVKFRKPVRYFEISDSSSIKEIK